MNTAVPPRYRHLLLLCVISAVFHLLVLALVARHAASSNAVPSSPYAQLAIRLVQKPPSSTYSMPAAQSGSVESQAPTSRTAVEPSPPSPERGDASEPAPAAPAPATPNPLPAPEPGSVTPASAVPEAGGPDTDQEPPQRYRVRMPAAIRLSYALTRRNSSGQPEAPQAAVLDWRTDGDHYELQMDGVLGRLSSSGNAGDSGIEPVSAANDTGRQRLVTTFDAAHRRVRFTDGSEGSITPGVQDEASFLMQLVGIGLARPDQVRDVVRLAVAGQGAIQVERFRVVGDEQVDTPVGALSAVHLAQLATPGKTRLDIWLAPARDWLPVMLRVTGSDGSSATQVVAKIEAAGAP